MVFGNGKYGLSGVNDPVGRVEMSQGAGALLGAPYFTSCSVKVRTVSRHNQDLVQPEKLLNSAKFLNKHRR